MSTSISQQQRIPFRKYWHGSHGRHASAHKHAEGPQQQSIRQGPKYFFFILTPGEIQVATDMQAQIGSLSFYDGCESMFRLVQWRPRR